MERGGGGTTTLDTGGHAPPASQLSGTKGWGHAQERWGCCSTAAWADEGDAWVHRGICAAWWGGGSVPVSPSVCKGEGMQVGVGAVLVKGVVMYSSCSCVPPT